VVSSFWAKISAGLANSVIPIVTIAIVRIDAPFGFIFMGEFLIQVKDYTSS
jgi:hypothetical protein